MFINNSRIGNEHDSFVISLVQHHRHINNLYVLSVKINLFLSILTVFYPSLK